MSRGRRSPVVNMHRKNGENPGSVKSQKNKEKPKSVNPERVTEIPRPGMRPPLPPLFPSWILVVAVLYVFFFLPVMFHGCYIAL